MPRRRTRSRRHTRRLHRTRRHRQRGGSLSLAEWRAKAKVKLDAMTGTFEEGGGTTKMLESLKDEALKLTPESPIVLPEYDTPLGGASKVRMATEGPGSVNTQTLRTLAANIVLAIKDMSHFETPLAFRNFVATLNTIQSDEEQKRLYSALSDLERVIRGGTEPVSISSGPLYIWAAVANLDTINPEEASVPLLQPSEDAEESKEAAATL